MIDNAWCGIDVAKLTFAAAFHPADLDFDPKRAPSKKFKRNEEGVIQLLTWIDEHGSKHHADQYNPSKVRVLMECTGRYSTELAALLISKRKTLTPALVNAHLAKSFTQSLGFRNKNDTVDSRALSRMGIERRPHPYIQLAPVQAELRELSRLRTRLVEERKALKIRAGEVNEFASICKFQNTQAKFFDKQISEVEKKMDKLLKRSDQLLRDFKLMITIPGIGKTIAVAILAELGDLSVFKRSRQVSAMVGLSPVQKQSGTSVHGRTVISKKGNAHARRALYMAGVTLMRSPETPLGAFYQRLVEAGKAKKSAICAVMRKLIILMRALVISGKPYDPEFDHTQNWRHQLDKDTPLPFAEAIQS